MNTLKFKNKSKAYNLLEVTVALLLTGLIIVNFINYIHNNSVVAKNNYMKWQEDKYLEIKNAGLSIEEKY